MHTLSKQSIFITLLFIGFLLSACQKSTAVDIEESSQQVGDVMSSIDESGGSGGALSVIPLDHQIFKKLNPFNLKELFLEKIVPSSYATACSLASTFGSCSSNVLTRDFSGCSVGAATLSGTVTLTWGGSSSNCGLTTAGDTITRSPNFTITGRRGATLTVSKTGTVGQRLTWSSGTGTSKVFSFTNDGIRRVFTLGASLDYTSQTTSAITVTGTRRSSRTMSGGTLRVTNNTTSVTCDYSPTDVAWSSTCNCASSGSWTGSCSDGKTTSISITGCGTANVTLGSDTQSVVFDRCYGI